MADEQAEPQQKQDLPQEASGKPEDQERFFAVLGYFAFLFLVTFVAKPKSVFCQFHAKQSMVMFLTTFFVLVILAAVPMVGSLFTLALFALYVVAIYRSYAGELWRIPFISGVADKINLSFLYSGMTPGTKAAPN